jgi:hypothetical protein
MKKIKTPDRTFFDLSIPIPELKTACLAVFAIGVSATRKLPTKRITTQMGAPEM